MRRWLAVLASMLTACAAVPFTTSDLPSDSCKLRALADGVDEWDRAIGHRRPYKLVQERRPYGETRLAITRCLSSHREVTIYEDVQCDRLAAVILHELVHVHLTCSDADHTEEGLMKAQWSSTPPAKLTPEIVERIKRKLNP